MNKKFTLFLFSVLLTPAAWSKSINFETLDKKTKFELLLEIPILKTEQFSRSDLESAIRWLVGHGNFDSAEYLSNDNEQFTFKVGKTKRIHAINILGNKTVGDADIRIAFGISEQSPFEPDTLLEAAKKIQQAYKDQGFFNPVIDLEFAPTANNEYDVLLKITENVQSKFLRLDFVTNNTALANSLKSLLSNQVGKPFSPIALKIMQKDIQGYFVKKHYFKGEVSEPAVTFSADESEVVVEFKIEHPESYYFDPPEQEKAEFNDVIENLGLSEYSSTAPNLAQELSNKIKAYYISQGYAQAEVNVIDKEGVEAFHRRLQIQVTKGSRVNIDKIEFTGRYSKTQKYYVEKLYDLSTPVFAKHRFVKEDLDKALKYLIIDSQNAGYFKAKIVSVRTLFNSDHDQVTISINLDEGPLTQIQKISFEGVSQIPEKDLLEQLNLQPQESLRLNVLEKGIDNIKKYYRDRGFLDMTITNEQNEKNELVSYNEDNTLANLKFKVFEGPKVLVGSIVVEGNTITKDYVVLKELEFKQGEVLTPALMEESIARLQRLGVFSSVEIKTLEEKTLITRRTVLVKINDRNPGLVNAGIGLTNQLGGTGRGYAGYAYRNIGGMARLFSARADVDYNYSSIQFPEKKGTISYLQPYLFDSRMRGRATLVDATFISDFSALHAEDLLQFTFSLEQEITSHLLVRWDLPNWARYSDFSINYDPNYPTTNVLIGSTGPTIELDYRDNPFNPTKGTFSRLNLEYGAPGILQSSPQVQFARGVLSVSHTLSVYKKIIWANQVRGGYLVNLQDPAQGGYVPWTQKGFLLGGPTTIRGFTVAEAFPSSAHEFHNTNYQLTTNSSMYLIKSELRLPVKGNFGFMVFFDGGAVQITGYDYGFTFRDSAGIGLLYNTPVGPAVFDIGWKLNEIGARGESPLALDISIGTF